METPAPVENGDRSLLDSVPDLQLDSVPDVEPEEGGIKNGYDPDAKVVRSSPLPKQSILNFMSDQYQMVSQQFYPFDAKLTCKNGSVFIHRLTLASMSPLLATVLNNDLEDIDVIYVDGADYSNLVELVEILYKGGSPSIECATVMNTLSITPEGIPKDFRMPVETPPPVSYKKSSRYMNYVKEEPDDWMCHFLDDKKMTTKAMELDTEEKIILSRLQEYFTPMDGEKLLRCTLCDEATEAENESMFEHFGSRHPIEMEDISVVEERAIKKFKGKGKKQRSKVWNYFERLEDEKALCRKCGAHVRINMGSTTQMIYHLRTKHVDDFDGFEEKRENEYLESDVLEEAEDADWSSMKKKKKNVKRRSKIWFYYKFVNEETSECKECGKRIVTAKHSRGSTSGLIHHLKHSHRELYTVFEAIKESRCATKDEFELVSSGVKLEHKDHPERTEVKKVKKEKKVKKQPKKKKMRIWAYFRAVSESWAQCNECQENVSMNDGSTSMMIHHLKRLHPPIFKLYDGDRETKQEMVMCEFCSETFDKRKLLQHNFSNHYENWAEIAKVRFDVVREKVRVKYEAGPYHKHIINYFSPGNIEGTVICKFCHSVVSKNNGQVESHIRCMHPELSVPDQMSQSYWLLSTPRAGRIICNLCGSQFDSERLYSSHVAESHKAEHGDMLDWDDVFSNTSDPFNFKLAVVLEKYDKTHNYWEHVPKPPHTEYGKMEDPVFRTCVECRKVFSTYSAMRYHQRVVHSGDKPFKCDMCGKAFNRKDTLDSHLASHSDLKPFMCSVCGKQFGRRHIRDTHERRHKKGEKKYACTMCTKRFMSSQQLKNHIRVHTGEKPFSCEHCGRMFAVKHQLVTHLRIHTGERPYGCNKCDQKFKHLSTRRNHKCVGDMKQPAQPEPVDVREALYRIPIPQSYHSVL